LVSGLEFWVSRTSRETQNPKLETSLEVSELSEFIYTVCDFGAGQSTQSVTTEFFDIKGSHHRAVNDGATNGGFI